MLDLSPNISRDVIGQLIGGGLKAVNHLLELANQGVPCLLLSLLPVLHMVLKLLDVYEGEIQQENGFHLRHANTS